MAIDSTHDAEPHAHFCVPYETRTAFAEMARQERAFVAGFLATSGLPFERWGEATQVCRARLLPELYAGLTRHTAAMLALHLPAARLDDLC